MLLETICDHYVATLFAGAFALWLGAHTVSQILVTVARERTRREIAAYVAEGAIDPEQAERLLKVPVDGVKA